MINKTIKVKCISGFKEENMDQTELLAEVFENEVYEAELYEETDEYFAKDSEGREFLVGEIKIDSSGNPKIKLSNEFELIENKEKSCMTVKVNIQGTDKLDFMMEEDEIDIDKLQKRVNVVNKFKKNLERTIDNQTIRQDEED